MRVILHIGGHKTASTYLQHYWTENADRLAKARIFYPKLYENGAHHVLAAPWLRLFGVPPWYFRDYGAERGWHDLWEQIPTDTKVLLLSAENFSRMAPKCVDIGELQDRFAMIGSLEILYLWRDPVALVQSIWLERFKSGDATGFDAMLTQALQTHMLTGVAVTPDLVWEWLRESMPSDHIHVIDYDWAKSHEAGVAGAVAAKLDLVLTGDDFVPVGRERSNVSPHPHAAFALEEAVSDIAKRRRLLPKWAAMFAPRTHAMPMAYTEEQFIEARAVFGRAEERFVDNVAKDGVRVEMAPRLKAAECDFRDAIREEMWLELARFLFVNPA